MRRTRFLVPAALVALTAVAVLLFFGYTCANPRDRVMVSINHIPEGTCFACIAYESNGVLRTFRWYPPPLLFCPSRWTRMGGTGPTATPGSRTPHGASGP